MAWTATDIPDLTGRIAVVTGANGERAFRCGSLMPPE